MGKGAQTGKAFDEEAFHLPIHPLFGAGVTNLIWLGSLDTNESIALSSPISLGSFVYVYNTLL